MYDDHKAVAFLVQSMAVNKTRPAVRDYQRLNKRSSMSKALSS